MYSMAGMSFKEIIAGILVAFICALGIHYLIKYIEVKPKEYQPCKYITKQ